MDFSFVDDVPTAGAPRCARCINMGRAVSRCFFCILENTCVCTSCRSVDRASASATGGTAALSGQKRPLFQIPSYAEVQRAERRDINATNLFQPSGLVFQALQGHQQPYPAQAGNNRSGQLPSSTSVGVARHGLPPTIPGEDTPQWEPIDRPRFTPLHVSAAL